MVSTRCLFHMSPGPLLQEGSPRRPGTAFKSRFASGRRKRTCVCHTGSTIREGRMH